MMFLAKRLGDITANDIAEMLPMFFLICIAICVICFILIKAKDSQNNDKPIRIARARIIDKDQPTSNAVTIIGWLLFETDEGERVKISIKAGHNFVVGDCGKLTWQGTRLINFIRER